MLHIILFHPVPMTLVPTSDSGSALYPTDVLPHPSSLIPPPLSIPPVLHLSVIPVAAPVMSASFLFLCMAPVSYHGSFLFSFRSHVLATSFTFLRFKRFSFPRFLADINTPYLSTPAIQSWNRLDFPLPCPLRRLRRSPLLLLLLPRLVGWCRASKLPHSRPPGRTPCRPWD
jgi:hypothetical protein